MTHTKKRSLSRILQEFHDKADSEPLTPDEQRAIMQVVTDLLTACGKSIERPLPGHDLEEVRGQNHVKRTLEVVAAGGHNILLYGPHLAGKSLLARTLPSILPTSAVPYPFCSPASTIQSEAFVGDLANPGELTRAHGGVLFLKNMHEFSVTHFASLRAAIETRVVPFPHGEKTSVFPANFLLVATTLPCPCGFYGDPIFECSCSVESIRHHEQHIRNITEYFDISVEVPRVREDMLSRYQEESSAQVQSRVMKARARQKLRYAETPHLWVNADLVSVDEVQHYCQMDSQAQMLMRTALQQLQPNPPSILRMQKVARTIADLDASEIILARHLAEAIQYRVRF